MRDADFAWLTEHSPDISREYAGKWIAVRDGEIIGIGETATEAAEKARTKAQDGDFILEAIDDKLDVIYGSL